MRREREPAGTASSRRPIPDYPGYGHARAPRRKMSTRPVVGLLLLEKKVGQSEGRGRENDGQSWNSTCEKEATG
jgi:hypothetical protein